MPTYIDTLDEIADRFSALGATQPKEVIREQLEKARAPLRAILDKYNRYAFMQGDERTGALTIRDVARGESGEFVAALVIDGTSVRTTLRYDEGE